ncbi:MAG: DMT family transporter [Campylobacterota bacterium]
MARFATLFVLLAAFFWGLTGGIAGILMEQGWEPYVMSLYRGGIGLLFVLLWLAVRPRCSGLSNTRLWFWAVFAGLGVAGNFSFYFISINQGSVAVAATLMYCAPVFVYLVSFAFKIEKPTPMKWTAIVLVMVGIVLLTRVYSIDAAAIAPLAVGAGLLSGLCYAAFIFGLKYAAPYGSPQAILSVAFGVLVAVLALPSQGGQVIAALGSQLWPLFILLGLLGAGVSFFLYIKGLHYTPPAVASILAMVEPVTASLFGIVLLDESLSGVQYLGMGLILVTVTMLSIHSGKSKVSPRTKAQKAREKTYGDVRWHRYQWQGMKKTYL